MMKKKTKRPPKIQILPTDNVEMEKFIIENRESLHVSIVDNIEYAINSEMLTAEIFHYERSPFIIMINAKDFKENLEYIFNESIKKEKFELCSKIKSMLKRLDSPRYNKHYKKLRVL